MMLTDALDELSYIKFYNLYASNPDNPQLHYNNWKSFQNATEKGISHRGTTMHRVGEGWFDQLSPMPFDAFWKKVSKRTDFQICLHRENLLRKFLSQKVGVVLRSYHVHKARTKDPGPIRIPVQELLEFIGTTKRLQEQINLYFPNRLTVTYEELDTKWNETITRIQEYIKLPPTNIQPVTVKQENRPLQEAIENYDELYSYLTNKGFGDWFNN